MKLILHQVLHEIYTRLTMSEGFHEVLRIVLMTIAVNGSPSCIPTIPSANFDSCSFWALDGWNQWYSVKFFGDCPDHSVKEGFDDALPHANQSIQSQMVNNEIVSPRLCFAQPTLYLPLQLTGLYLGFLNGVNATQFLDHFHI